MILKLCLYNEVRLQSTLKIKEFKDMTDEWLDLL